MKRISPIVLGLSLAVAGSLLSAAQEMSSQASIPKVLQITREFIKPGKSGMVHDRSESNFVQAMARAKWPTHYIALGSLSGKSRALYLTQYGSFEAWEKDNAAVAKNATLSSELDRAEMTDGELLDSFDQAVGYYNEELSYRARTDLSQARFMEISVYNVRPGHGKEWRDLVKMVIDGYQKAGTSAHWATFEMVYGRDGGTFIVLSSSKSLSEIDTNFAEDKQFMAAMGEDGMKKLEDLVGSAVEHSDHELFSINARQSYPPDEWVKADPAFWRPKPAMAAAAKPAATPAAEPKKANP
jgi:hypothetical protein